MFKSCILVTTFFLALYLAPVAPAAEPPACKGLNVLDELKSTNPGLHKEIMEEAARFKNGKSVFWRIEKLDVPPSYLFGTIHVTDPRVHNLPAPVAKAFDASRVLILEAINLTNANMGKALMSVMPQSMFSPIAGKTLADYLTTDEMAFTTKLSTSIGVPANVVKLVKPWLIAVSLAVPPCEQKRASAGLVSLDAKLEGAAKKKGKPTIGLETPEQQLRAMASMTLEAQVAWLKNSIELYDRSEDFLETMIELYLKRDLGVMIPLSIKISKDQVTARTAMESFQDRLITKRNLGMVKRAKSELDKGGAFMAVGALHLGGDQGLVELLRKEGYRITPLE